jgi:heme/copper-type cytochrome/quinol oxidase subunit 3
MASGTETRPEYAYEGVEVGDRNLAVATRLGAAAQAFFFISFLFAFFYLRALNTLGRWNHKDLQPSRAYGTVILVCVLGSVAATVLAAWAARKPDAGLWRIGMVAAIGLVIAAIVVQSVQYVNLGFGPGDGSFAAVFVGWTGLLAANMVGVLYWLWTLLAETLNRRGRALELLRGSTEAVAVYWGTLGLIALVAWILLYFAA